MDKDFSKKIDVSIIIVNYKDYEMTERCIVSIVEHTKSLSYEIVLVDNCSDQDKAFVFQTKYPFVVFIANQTNKGFAAANNQALKLVQGRYVLLLNNDTLFIEDTLQKVFDFVENIKSKCFIGCKLLNEDLSHQDSIFDFDHPGNVLGESLFLYKIFPDIRFFNKYFLNRLEYKTEIQVDVIKGAFIFSQTEQLKKLGGFNEKFYFYGEEIDLCYRFKREGGKIFYFPATAIIHKSRATSMRNLRFKFLNQTKAKLQIFSKHSRGFKLIWMITFYYLGILLRIPLYLIIGIVKFEKLSFLKSYYYFRILFVESIKE